MFTREESIHIEASPEAVYAYISDIGRHPEWAAQKLVMQPLGGGKFQSLMTMGAMKAVAVIHVEAADPPRMFCYVADDNVSGPHRWTFLIAPDGVGSKVTFRMDRMHDALLFRLLQPTVMWPLIGHPGVLKGLARIKAALERPQEATAAAPAGG